MRAMRSATSLRVWVMSWIGVALIAVGVVYVIVGVTLLLSTGIRLPNPFLVTAALYVVGTPLMYQYVRDMKRRSKERAK